MESLLPQLAVPFQQDVNSPSLPPLETWFGAKSAYWLEIGFGGGEHLAWQAKANPEIGMIGAEPFINGVAKLVSQIHDDVIDNIRIHHGDARPLMSALPDDSVERIFVLHPDPWPKTRHHKRRMISDWFFREAARLLKPGGHLRVASDIPDYIAWSLVHAFRHEAQFVWLAERADEWRTRPEDWPQTRYEAKALQEGRAATYLTFERTKS